MGEDIWGIMSVMVPSRFTLLLSRDEEEPESFNVSVKELPGCYTHGKTVEECIARSIEAIQGFLESQAQDGEIDLPAELSFDEIEVGLTIPTTP